MNPIQAGIFAGIAAFGAVYTYLQRKQKASENPPLNPVDPNPIDSPTQLTDPKPTPAAGSNSGA